MRTQFNCKVVKISVGFGDPSTWCQSTRHPNDPRTEEKPQHVLDAEFDALVQKKLDYINDNVNGEYSVGGTSNGVTGCVLPVFGSVLAGLSDEDVQQLLAVYSWHDKETTENALKVLRKAAEWACKNVAEAQVECGWEAV